MISSRSQELFESYFHYWTVKLKLHKQYKFILKKDNRLNCHAQVETADKPYHYVVRYNTSRLRAEYKIINVVLHEIGHLLFDLRIQDDVFHEAEAEYFSLSTMKEHYKKFYKKALNWTKKSIEKNTTDEIHKQGYITALERLGEL